MVNRIIALFLVLAILAVTACVSPRVARARQQIEALHQGALLVRLPGTLPSGASGASSEADSIVRAFELHYTFSPVYYTFSSEPATILRADEENPERMLSPAGPAETIALMAEFGTVYDTPLLVEDEDGIRPAGGVGGLPALVVKDLRGVQLDDPFPYRVTTNYRPGDRGRAVELLNSRLQAYFLSVQRKRLKQAGRELD